MISQHRMLRCLLFAVTVALSACASVTTRIVPLNPAQIFPPTQSVEVLLAKPTRPHIEIAMLEARGGSEADLFNDAREKARQLGADAIVRLEVERQFHPPVALYDPWYDPFYWSYYRRPFGPFGHPWGPYHVLGGTSSYLLKVMAIRYSVTRAVDG